MLQKRNYRRCYNGAIKVYSSSAVKRESTQVENESGKAYHLISKVCAMTFVCPLWNYNLEIKATNI